MGIHRWARGSLLLLLFVLSTSAFADPQIALSFLTNQGVSVLEESEALQLFDALKNKRDFRYRREADINNGACATRAEALNDFLRDKKNLKTARVWIECKVEDQRNSIRAVEQISQSWYYYGNYHVANVVLAKDAAGVLKPMVFDPQFQPVAKSLETYLDQVVFDRVNYKNLTPDEAIAEHGVQPCEVVLATYSHGSIESAHSARFY